MLIDRLWRRGVASLTAAAVSIAFCALVPCFGNEAEEGSEDEKTNKKVVLIGHKLDHPPGTHLYLPECELLAKCLRQTDGVEAIVSDGWPTEAGILSDVDAIVLYSSPGAEILLGGSQAEQFETLMKRGVGLVAIHWATGLRNPKDEALGNRYLSYLGGLFSFAFSGLDVSESEVRQMDGKHAICRGWKGFKLKDEYYLNLKFLPEAKPILQVPVKGKNQTVAWAYERPDSNGGRSYGNTLGHFHAQFEREVFRRMLVNGILWTLHVTVPPDGAPCAK